MNTPYTTKSGLQIGCNYQPPAQRWVPTRTEAMLQDALLDQEYPLFDRDGLVIIAGCALSMVIVFAWLWA